METNAKHLSNVFQDAEGHRSSAGIIRDHSSNQTDIRYVALKEMVFSDCRSIVDLGCGFGYFTEALTNRIKATATVTGIDCHESYRRPFLDLCTRGGFRGEFTASGTEYLKTLPSGNTDLILCSYSLYFFPGILSEISRILKPDGKFVVITHSERHLTEISEVVLKEMNQQGFYNQKMLPNDKLVASFPGESGKARLSPYFDNIIEIKYQNSLKFNPQTVEALVTYFKFKQNFFIPSEFSGNKVLIADVENELRRNVIVRGEMEITKNDYIFICKEPIQ